MPAEIKELADRAVKLVELQKGPGKYEQLLRERDGKIKVLEETVEEGKKTIMGMQSLIEALKSQKATG
jgi:hypothetical protein